MLRDKSLIPLSHQHQRALALCVRIDRAQPIPDADLEAWQAEIEHISNSKSEFISPPKNKCSSRPLVDSPNSSCSWKN
jgi:hypothetical protein